MGQKWGVPAKSGNVLENVGSGAMAYGSGLAQELRASFAKDSVPDEFDRINQWMDTGDNKNLADAVRRVDNTHGAYTDADLIRKGGWTQEQIDEARKMNAALDAIPAWQRGVRRHRRHGGCCPGAGRGVRRTGGKEHRRHPEELETGGAGGKGRRTRPEPF